MTYFALLCTTVVSIQYFDGTLLFPHHLFVLKHATQCMAQILTDMGWVVSPNSSVDGAQLASHDLQVILYLCLKSPCTEDTG